MSSLVSRNATSALTEMMTAFRLVILGGARQTGKSTLVTDLLGFPPSASFTLDDVGLRRRALEDPSGFVAALPRPAAVDEFQRAGEALLLAVKERVDRDRSRGQFLLTGSASYLADRSVTETLAGRAGRLVLWPLSAGERRGVRERFVDRLFDPDAWPPAVETTDRRDLVAWMREGGFPELVTEGLGVRQRTRWFDAYVDDVVSREALRPLADVRRETDLRRVLKLLAARTAQELVISGLTADSHLDRGTVASYVALLEALYLVVLVPAWATSATTRAKRHPKVFISDPGLAAHLAGTSDADFGPHSDGRTAGALFETTVVTEIAKQATWSDRAVELSHFRDRNGAEVDLIVEDRHTGALAGIEVKLTSSPSSRDARHLALLRDRLPGRFTTGLVVHAGPYTLPLGDRLWAVPVSALWRPD